jgi:Mlc titration factor MtfA (ptsG expression regulator)
VFTWWRNRRRQQLLAQPFPHEWEAWLATNFRHLAHLTAAEQTRLRNDLRLLVTEKHWEACKGLEVTDEMRVTISAHAALLGLGFEQLPFARLQTVLLYAEPFVWSHKRRPAWSPASPIWGAVVGEEEVDEVALGQAGPQGPVVLVWSEVIEQCRNAEPRRNVVIHEFAHLLDAHHDSMMDGLPELDHVANVDAWVDTFDDEFERLIRQARLGRKTVLDYYGTTSEAEFFAVASEAFFEQPVQLRRESPELYTILKDFYRQDPATRTSLEAQGDP